MKSTVFSSVSHTATNGMCVLAAWISLASITTTAKAVDPVTVYIATYAGEYLAGKGLDAIWETATGKPDIRILDRRLMELETNVIMRSEMRDEIRKLRNNVNERTTKDEFRRMALQTTTEISNIKQRLDELEQRVELLEIENEDSKKGSHNAASGEFFETRGGRFLNEGNLRRAMTNYALALQLDPSLVGVHLSRCNVYKQMGAFEIVVFEATEGITKAGESGRFFFYAERAAANARLGNSLKVVEDSSKLIDDSPSDVSFRLLRGVHALKLASDQLFGWDGKYFRDGKFSWPSESPEGIKQRAAMAGVASVDFNEAIRLDPTSVKARWERALLWRAFGDDSKALSDLNEAIKLDAKDKKYLIERARVFAGKEPHSAIVDLTAALTLDPSDEQAFCFRALCYGGLGDTEREIGDYEMAFRIGYLPAAGDLAQAYKKMGNSQKAKYYSDLYGKYNSELFSKTSASAH